jgi:GAF domain-containing protein
VAAGGHERRRVLREEKLVEVFVDLADTLVDDYDVAEFLQMLTYRCAEVLEVDAVGVLLMSEEKGALDLAAASTDEAAALELFQMQNDEGPCRDAFHTGEQVVVPDIEGAADRWPSFAVHARRSGFSGVHAFPMRLRGQNVGALNLFSKGSGPQTEAEIRTAKAVADIATIGILQQRALRDARSLAAQLEHALSSRTVIEQAKGVLMARTGIGAREAFEVLRRHSRTHNRSVHRLAQDLIDEVVLPENIV